MPVPQLTKREAILFYVDGNWQEMSDLAIANLQLYQERTCVPFGRFHEALEHVLGRPIWSCEFVMLLRLMEEYERRRRKLTILSTAMMFAILLISLLGGMQ
ncbi:MAG: DUF7736 domain-containing protein [Candidatus Thorarchaeota archaeon]|jgi:hypothetical protein